MSQFPHVDFQTQPQNIEYHHDHTVVLILALVYQLERLVLAHA